MSVTTFRLNIFNICIAEIISDNKKLQELNDHWDDILPHLLDYNFTSPVEKHPEISQLIRDEYLKGKSTLNAKEEIIKVAVFYSYIKK